jgi:Cof subfamily protein (haloacid dehalogenase superfamily)
MDGSRVMCALGLAVCCHVWAAAAVPPAQEDSTHIDRLAVFDLDGTLLNDQSLVSRECVKRIRAAMVPGLVCTVASGRDMDRISPFIEQLGWTSVPVIAEQGAVVVLPADSSILMEKRISRNVILGALESVRCAPVPINIILYGRSEPQVFRNVGAPSLVEGWASGWYAGRLRDIPEPEDIATATVRKITLKCLPDDTDTVKQLLTRSLGNGATVVKADVDFVNVMDAGVNKGSALAWLIRYLGVDAGHVMTVGDCEADQSMFAQAGVSVAVANADEETRSQARFVVPSNVQQGAAVALERFAAGEYGV